MAANRAGSPLNLSDMKKKSIPSLKEELLILQSQWVKLYYSSGSGFANCFTCDTSMNIKSDFCQTGHCFSKSGYPALQFVIFQQMPQCKHCNDGLNGNEEVFKQRLKIFIGEEKFSYLEAHKNDTVKLDRSILESLINDFKNKLKELQ